MSTNPIVIVTGSNTGIGLETVRALLAADKPYTVVLCSRNLKKGQEAAEKLKSEAKQGSEVIPLQLDIDDDASIKEFVKDVEAKFGRVDVLINNAGISLDRQLAQGQVSPRDAWNRAYSTNVTSTHMLTTALMPLLFATVHSPSQTRILFVTSGVGSHAWLTSAPQAPVNKPSSVSGWPKPPAPGITAYRSSKSGMNMMFHEWARILASDPIKCHLVCPGLVATNLGGNTPDQMRDMGAGEPGVAGKFFRDVVEGKYDEYAGVNGKLVSQGHPVEW